MKILMLTTNASLMDGINRHILSISAAINRLSDCEVAVCTVMPHGDLNTALKQVGVKTYALGFRHGHDSGIVRAFAKVIKDFRPEIIHSHVMAMMERVYLSYSGRGIKVIETIHGISDAKQVLTFRDRLESMIYRLSPINISARCFISKGVCEALKKTYKGTTINTVIYNPCTFDKIPQDSHRLHDELSLSHSTPIIGTACRISFVKNPEAFTDVMCRILSKISSAHAVIIGDGDNRIILDCKQIVESYGVSERFHWMGYRTDAPELVSGLNCFILTSRSEGMPTSVLECFASGTPVAMMEGNGGLKDIVSLSSEEKPIVLHSDPDDTDQLVQQIIGLLCDNQKASALARNAFEVGSANFSLEAVTSQLHKIYKRVLE